MYNVLIKHKSYQQKSMTILIKHLLLKPTQRSETWHVIKRKGYIDWQFNYVDIFEDMIIQSIDFCELYM